MSGSRMDRNVDQTLAAWMGDVAPDRAPSALLEGTFARTMKTRQARAYPWHRLRIGALTRPVEWSGGRTGALVLVGLLVAVLAVGLLVGSNGLVTPPLPSPSPTAKPGPSAKPTATPLPPSVVVAPEAVIPVQGPIAMVPRDAMIWVMGTGELARIDPVANAVTATVTLGPSTELYNGLAANDAGLWATNSDAALLYRVDPVSLEVAARIPAGLATKGVLATAAGVWVADVHGGTVLRVDPATNTVVATITVGPAGNSGPNWLASGFDSIWTNIPNNRTVVRFDPDTNAILATIPIPAAVLPCGGFEFETTVVWVTQCGGGLNLVAGIDPATNTVIGIEDHVGFGAIPTLIDGGLWASIDTGDAESGLIGRIDRATNSIDRVLVTGSAFGGGGALIVFAGSVWAVDGYNNAVLRLPLAAFAP